MGSVEVEEAAGLLHVFDLPQLYTRPTPQALLSTLTLLTSAPPSWECSDSEEQEDDTLGGSRRRAKAGRQRANVPQVDSAGLTRYLTSIIASDLRWVSDDAVKEEIWEQASLRLSERSGRSAMPAISRTFQIPVTPRTFHLPANTVDITIHEPALTADNLGFKTWSSSYMLARRLHSLELPIRATMPGLRILELGAGTGLVGIAAAAIFGAKVLLTDLPEIVPNLARNAETNKAVFQAAGGSTATATLDWTQPDVLVAHDCSESTVEDLEKSFWPARFPVIVAADSLYSPEHPKLLVQTIKRWLSDARSSRVIVELPLREGYQPEIEDFRLQMGNIGLRIVEQGEEVGYDDWGYDGGEGDNLQQVKCWWSVWGWE